MRRISAMPGCAVLALLTSCAIQAPVLAPQDLQASFDLPSELKGRPPTQEWYRAFSSDELNAFVDSASGNNLDIAAASARVAQADARAIQAGAALLPTIDAVGKASFLAGHSSQGSGHELDWSALLSASYEIDFWGKNRATRSSALYLAKGSRADRDTVTLTTLAGVAQGYFQVLALRDRLAIARSNQDAAQQLLDVINARLAVGAAAPVELATQRSVYDAAQIAKLSLQQMESEARAALALLLGRAPEEFEVRGQPLDSLAEPSIAAGLPSELLARRPDIARAEENLRASQADLIVARAALFPSFTLTGSAGVQNPALQAAVLTIGGSGPSFALGANLVQTIFDHGRLRAQRAEVQARNRELLSAYRAAILAALVDVENALSAIRHLEDARQFQIDNVAQSEKAYEGARLRYQSGKGDFLLVLETQRTLFAARDQFVQYKLGRLQALVSLSKALGGGWSQHPTADSPATTPKWTTNP